MGLSVKSHNATDTNTTPKTNNNNRQRRSDAERGTSGSSLDEKGRNTSMTAPSASSSTATAAIISTTNRDVTRDRERRNRQKAKATNYSINTIVYNPFFILFSGLLLVSCFISFFLVFSHPEGIQPSATATGHDSVIRQLHGPKPSDEEMRLHHQLTDAQKRDQIMHGIPEKYKNTNKKLVGKDGKKMVIGEGVAAGVRKAAAGLDPAGFDAATKEEDAGDDDDTAGEEEEEEEEEPTEEEVETTVPEHMDPLGIQNKHKQPKKKRANHIPKSTPLHYHHIPDFDTSLTTPHLLPLIAPLPVFNDQVDNKEQLIKDLLHNNKPTIAGIIAFMNAYQKKLHDKNKQNAIAQHRDKTGNNIDAMALINSYFDLTTRELDPLENAYRGRTIFPIREDNSLFISLAAFRETLLGKSLMSAFDHATHPDKLFFGIVVQNCFGMDGTVCSSGVEVIGEDKAGRPITSISPKPPDPNGVDEFCSNPDYQKYCDSGQVRVIYVHDTDALGPQTARYYASKLWGGETYFMQMDSHLEFAPAWDTYYIDEAKASKNFPKSVLSAYPPGFTEYDGKYQGGTPGARLCQCQFSSSPVENHILRISMGGNTPHDAPFPTQIPFIAAGFFFAHASFLQDVPFDPYAPWCFMGEEIALSVRAWTFGWNIYAPRKNMIAHQYRPGRLGIPKFWESVGRDSGRAGLNTRLQKHVLRRVKYLMGYTTDSEELLVKDGDSVALTNFEHYSTGHVRTLEDYLELTDIDVVAEQCHTIDWCQHSTMA